MPPKKDDPKATTEVDDPLEKAEAAKEKKTGSTTEGMKGEKDLDAAIEDAEKA